jgi:UDPglucose--hexose-1-phosphate uridylyltransferase
MSQLRQNPVSKDWVLIAPNRSKRPDEFAAPAPAVPDALPEIDPSCPFCPGNEKTNIELARLPKGKNWTVRVIPNKFEALAHIPLSTHREFYEHRTGSGDHEVIITRKHNEPIALQPITTVALTLQVLRQRLLDLATQQHIAYAHIFHNHGHAAGASITHPHYQILATPMVPSMLHTELTSAYDYYRNNGTNIYADIIREEKVQAERVILETDHFIVLAPYASQHPFESVILPKYQAARFEASTDEQLKDLAFALKAVMASMFVHLHDPAVNFYVHTMPFRRSRNIVHDETAYRWHITIFPRLVVWAGFEFGTGIPVNPVTPEDAAALLKS